MDKKSKKSGITIIKVFKIGQKKLWYRLKSAACPLLLIGIIFGILCVGIICFIQIIDPEWSPFLATVTAITVNFSIYSISKCVCVIEFNVKKRQIPIVKGSQGLLMSMCPLIAYLFFSLCWLTGGLPIPYWGNLIDKMNVLGFYIYTAFFFAPIIVWPYVEIDFKSYFHLYHFSFDKQTIFARRAVTTLLALLLTFGCNYLKTMGTLEGKTNVITSSDSMISIFAIAFGSDIVLSLWHSSFDPSNA